MSLTIKANMLNNYFSTCFNASLPPLSGSYETAEHLELLEGTHESLLCTEEYVMDLLQNIDVSKASGQDQISGRMLKATAASIAARSLNCSTNSFQLAVFLQHGNNQTLYPSPNVVTKVIPQTIDPSHCCQCLANS